MYIFQEEYINKNKYVHHAIATFFIILFFLQVYWFIWNVFT